MKLSNSELKLLELIWQEAPVKSGALTLLALDKLGWQKSTVYTVIKKLTLKGAIVSENSVISPCLSRSEVMDERSEEIIRRGYSGSLPMFLTAFLKKEKLTQDEAEELKKLIDEYTETEGK